MIVALLAFSLSLILLYALLFNGNSKARKYPPGPVIWPVLGNMVEVGLRNPNYPHLAFAEMSKKYGEIMTFGLGVHFSVMLSSEKMMREVLTKSETCGRYAFSWAIDRAFGKRNMGIIWNIGESHKTLHSFTVKKLRETGIGKLSWTEQVIHTEASQLVEKIKGERDLTTGDFFVNQLELNASTVNILWGTMTGIKFPPNDPTVLRMVELNEIFSQVIGFSNLYGPLPFLKTWFPKLSGWERHMQTFKEMQAFMSDTISKIKEGRVPHQQPGSFVECFLQEIEKRKDDPNETNFTDEQLNIILSDFFFAGTETKSATVMWSLLFLSEHPEVQEKIYKEILDVIGNDNQICYSHQQSMPYTKAAMLEIQRRANIGPITGMRETIKDFTVGEYTVPKGTVILFNLHPIFFDEEFWGDPDHFRPERFLEKGESEKDYQLIKERTDKMACAFGFGSRICTGNATAMMAIFIYLTTLVRHFKFSVIPGKKPSWTPRPQSGVYIPWNFHIQANLRN